MPYRLRKYLCLTGLLLAVLACTLSDDVAVDVPLPVTQTRPTLAGTTPTIPALDDWYNVYFTNPGGPESKRQRGGPDAHLAAAIDAASASVDLAVLELDLWSIRDALLDAHRRGVKVRVVIESEYLSAPEVQALKKAGIPLADDRQEGLMHNKFVVIDRQEVWTGSMNFSISEAYRNDNNLIRIRSLELAENYTVEFEEMFSQHQFGPGSPANTPKPDLTIQGTRVQVCFAPEDGCAARIIAALQTAQAQINFLAFSFTADPLADVLLERARAGIPVLGVMEAAQISSNTGGDYEKFIQAGLDVRQDGNRNYMHNKVMLIDNAIVVTGSYNFTRSGETRNDENLLIIYSPQVAAWYAEQFARLYAEANP